MELSNQYIISVVLYLLLVSQSLVMLVDFICAGMRRRIIMEQIVDDLKVTQNVWSGVNGVNCGVASFTALSASPSPGMLEFPGTHFMKMDDKMDDMH